MSSKYRLLKKYPSLPKDWEVGMEVIRGINHSDKYFPSKVASDIFFSGININEVENNPDYWEKVEELCVPIGSKFKLNYDNKLTFLIKSKLSNNRIKVVGNNSVDLSIEYINNMFKNGTYILIKEKPEYPKIISVNEKSPCEKYIHKIIDNTIVNSPYSNWSTSLKECLEKGICNIYQVAQSSETTFTIGDRFVCNSENYHLKGKVQTITGFEVNNVGNILVKIGKCKLRIEKIEKVKPILRTEDNIDIYIGDKYYCNSIDGNIPRIASLSKENYTKSSYKYFSTKESLEKWVSENKLKEILITDDGIKIFKGDSYWLVAKDFTIFICTATTINSLESSVKRFSTEQKALEYVDLNKKIYSKQDILDATEKLLSINNPFIIINREKLNNK